jgi:hypothetical protein
LFKGQSYSKHALFVQDPYLETASYDSKVDTNTFGFDWANGGRFESEPISPNTDVDDMNIYYNTNLKATESSQNNSLFENLINTSTKRQFQIQFTCKR